MPSFHRAGAGVPRNAVTRSARSRLWYQDRFTVLHNLRSREWKVRKLSASAVSSGDDPGAARAVEATGTPAWRDVPSWSTARSINARPRGPAWDARRAPTRRNAPGLSMRSTHPREASRREGGFQRVRHDRLGSPGRRCHAQQCVAIGARRSRRQRRWGLQTRSPLSRPGAG